MSNQSQPGASEEEEGNTLGKKYETITAQFWPADLAQLRQLIEAGKNRESIGQLRRMAMHIGVLMLSLSARALLSGEDHIGLYTAKEIADELLPLIDPAVQTLGRLGYPVHPYPAGINTLLEMMARLASTPAVSEVAQQVLPPEDEARTLADTQSSQAARESDRSGGERLLPSKDTLKRLNIDEEGTV